MLNNKLNINIFVISAIVLWFAIFVYWVIKSKNRGVVNEITGLVKLLFSGLILFLPAFFIVNFLSFKSLIITNIAGLTFVVFGFVICILAREYLASNWSGKVTIQQKHSLIKNGPYKRIRHPIYSGVLLMMLGTGIITGNFLNFVWIIFCFFGLYRKSIQEEKLLRKEFSDEYENYQEQTKMLIPYIL